MLVNGREVKKSSQRYDNMGCELTLESSEKRTGVQWFTRYFLGKEKKLSV